MTRNQLLPKNANLTGVMFTVENKGDISPSTKQYVYHSTTIVLHKDESLDASIIGVCARQGTTCKCTTLVGGVSSGNHMAIGTEYTVNNVPLNSQYELYAVTGSGPVANATNGDIYVGV